jgi:hypothetical protein
MHGPSVDIWSAPRWRLDQEPTLRSWHRADDGIVFNGADVLTWQDLSASGRDIGQATPANQPLYVASGGPNNAPYLEFDGVSEYLTGTWAQAQPITRWIVVMPSVSGAGAGTFADGGALNSARAYISAANAITMRTSLLVGPVAAVETNWHYVRMIFNGATSSLAVDGGTPATGNAGLTAPGGLTLGSTGLPNVWVDCRVAEVIELDGVASATIINQVEHYLRTRYAL